MKNRSNIFVGVVACLSACQVVVILLSWLADALFPSSGITSLLSSTGLRWLLSSYESNVNTSLFFYVLLACFAIGALVESGMCKKLIAAERCNYNERLAITLFFISIAVAVLLCCAFAFHPQSLLMSVDGSLWHGPFLKAVLLIFAVVCVGGGCVYVLLTNSVSTREKLSSLLTAGLCAVAPLAVVYFFTIELVRTILYIFGV